MSWIRTRKFKVLQVSTGWNGVCVRTAQEGEEGWDEVRSSSFSQLDRCSSTLLLALMLEHVFFLQALGPC